MLYFLLCTFRSNLSLISSQIFSLLRVKFILSSGFLPKKYARRLLLNNKPFLRIHTYIHNVFVYVRNKMFSQTIYALLKECRLFSFVSELRTCLVDLQNWRILFAITKKFQQILFLNILKVFSKITHPILGPDYNPTCQKEPPPRFPCKPLKKVPNRKII